MVTTMIRPFIKHIVLLFWILPIVTSSYHPLANFTRYEAIDVSKSSRNLQIDGIKDFLPLQCNTNLATTSCIPWTDLFGTETNYTYRVVIPCGQCVIMDLPGGKLDLLEGLDIIGKLVVPDGYMLNLTSSIIAVQGELEMTATKTIDGNPNIKITMIGDTINTFTPYDINTAACNGTVVCTVGKKGIIVAGGKLNIHGMPENTLAWTHLYDVDGISNNPTTIFVPSSVIGKWGAGAEILITPHTRVWNQNQVRTIKSVQLSGEYAALLLSAPILRPTTMVESRDFAVEVALLSRNIVFEGGPDSIPQHGGHFMIMHTPNVRQTIEGVEIKNFGQQGALGRYPIHFHFCSNVEGSIVSKNTIRQSNQRCVVVHGTDKLRIEENVAFDTKGHCYMTEDGIEKENIFIRNIGAQTGVPTTLIPNLGSNGDETDDEPATFWISAPSNYFIGNVAAGSQHSGYWFEPKLRGVRAILFPGFNPQYSPLGSFIDNVAHSNTALNTGAVRTYQPGYFPTEMTPFTRLKVYRNNAIGIKIHRCNNIRIDQGLFADNYMGIDLDRAEGIEVTNTAIVGKSPSYDALMARQPGIAAVCDRNERVGIDLHTWQKDISFLGAKITNVSMSGFAPNDPKCLKPRSLRFDKFNLKQGLFEFYTAFESIRLADGTNSIDMCVVTDAFHDFVYFIDLDGSFRPNPFMAPKLSTLVASDNKKHMTFVDAMKCTDNPVGCYSYCQDTCFRSMRYLVQDLGQANFTVKVCSTSNQTLCSFFKGGRRDNVGPHEFTVHLPIGQSYDAVFVNSIGIEVTPSKVTESVEKTYCPDGPFSVTLKMLPPVTQPFPSPILTPVSLPIKTSFPVAMMTGAPDTVPTTTVTKAPTKNPSKISTTIPTYTPTNKPIERPTGFRTNSPSVATNRVYNWFLSIWTTLIKFACRASKTFGFDCN